MSVEDAVTGNNNAAAADGAAADKLSQRKAGVFVTNGVSNQHNAQVYVNPALSIEEDVHTKDKLLVEYETLTKQAPPDGVEPSAAAAAEEQYEMLNLPSTSSSSSSPSSPHSHQSPAPSAPPLAAAADTADVTEHNTSVTTVVETHSSDNTSDLSPAVSDVQLVTAGAAATA